MLLNLTHAGVTYTNFEADALLSAGVPEAIHNLADHLLLIPMTTGMRSINVALAAAMVTGEALRQVAGFPTPSSSLQLQ